MRKISEEAWQAMEKRLVEKLHKKLMEEGERRKQQREAEREAEFLKRGGDHFDLSSHDREIFGID